MAGLRIIPIGISLVVAIMLCGCVAGEFSQNESSDNDGLSLNFDYEPSDVGEPREAAEEKMSGADIDYENDPAAASVGGPHLKWVTAVVEEVEDRTMTVAVLDDLSEGKKAVRVKIAAWVDSLMLDRIHPGAEVRFSYVTDFGEPIRSEVVAYGVEIVAA